jgi:L-seryl-tRNA(Ser) seleniumtransferase
MTDPRRLLPSVDTLLASDDFRPLLARYPRERVLAHLRERLSGLRSELASGWGPGDVTSATWWAEEVAASLAEDAVPSLRRVINATGVVLHTNLGRAPLAVVARDAMADAARGYTNLEYDLEEGKRGSRYVHCADLLAELADAEAALVVNNAAAALVLALNTLARARGVVVSRGELVEIGGGFRIPEILERSGARLIEVGSTNRTRAADYEEALRRGDVAALLKVHRSNFRMTGFTEEVSIRELAALGASAGVPVLFDLGSGLFADPVDLRLPREPRAREALAEGADLVVVSGDKLMGGPQAGIVLGQARIVAAMRENPLCRALRVDKVTLAGIEATARLYRDPARALREIPVLRMIAEPEESIRKRAELLAEALVARGVVSAATEPTAGAVGGGTCPDVPLPSWAVVLGNVGAQALARALRAGDPPVVGRIEDDRLLLDVRTVQEDEIDALVRRVVEASREAGA